MIREIGHISAINDEGKEYEIVKYQKYIDVSTHDNPNTEIPGLKTMKTTEGYTLILLTQIHSRL